MAEEDSIFPIFDRTLSRADKEGLLKQRSAVVWMTGLSGSGKSTIAIGLERRLHEKGYLTKTLDGDNVRTGIASNLGFSKEDREENVRRIAEVSKLFLHCGVITINCFVSPMRSMREKARNIVGEEDFHEVYVNAPLAVCEERDPKGLYKKARDKEIEEFTGVSAPFEAPENPEKELKTEGKAPEETVDELLEHIMPFIEYK